MCALTTKKRKRKRQPHPMRPGFVQVNFHLPANLHEQMKAIRQERCDSENAEVKLNRVYREAIEHFVRNHRNGMRAVG